MSEILEPATPESDVFSSFPSLTLTGEATLPRKEVVSISTDSIPGHCSDPDPTCLHSAIPNDDFFRALSFLLEYEQSRDTVHLEAALKEYRVLLERTPVENADYLAFQSFLCDALCEQFDLWGDLAVMEEAVEVGDAVVSASCTSHPDYFHHLCCMAKGLTLRYEATTDEYDVTRAVTLAELAKTGIEHESADKACILMTHGTAHLLYFEARGDLQSLQQASASFMSALLILNEGSSDRAACLASLSTCYSGSTYAHHVPDLSKWVFYAKSAVDLTSSRDPRLACRLSRLAAGVRNKWEMHPNPQLLQESIFLSKSAMRCLVAGDRRQGLCLTTYGTGLFRRHQLLGSIEDLNECARLYEKALGLRGKRERNYYMALSNYCNILYQRFRATGSLQDLDTSILEMQKLIAELSPAETVAYRRNLGAFIFERYNFLKRPEDLLCAIQIAVENAAAHPTSGMDLYNAGEVYHRLYERTCEVAHLNSAIEYLQAADSHVTIRQHLSDHHAVFGSALVSLACLSAYPSDWDKAVQRLRLAVHHAPPGHWKRPEALRMLAGGLRQRFGAFSNCQDIRESIAILSDSLADAAAYNRAKTSSALGESMAVYFESFQDMAYLQSALHNFQSAAQDEEGFISDRFYAALTWATLAQNNAYRSSALSGYRLAVQLLPHVAWVGFGKHVRLQELQKQAATLAVDAAAAAIENRQYEAAVELLESGRGILWSQLLQLRTDVVIINEVAPGLATELQDVGRALQMDVAGSGGLEGELLLQRQRRLAERWERLLAEVRKIDGYQTFLAPPKFGDLLSSASDGPVVIFNASASQCDALIVAPEIRVHHCPLRAMKMDYALHLSKFLRQALMVPKDGQGTVFLDGAVSNVLDRLWTTVGVPVWQALRAIYPDGVPRRVWFCPTGPFCLLPLHAAKPIDGPGFPDLFICSYTATLSSLMRARADREHAGQNVDAPAMLAVSQPATPGYEPLECAVEEMRIIYDSVLGETTTFLNGSDATVANVCEEMLDNKWIHFSCHGSSNTENPLETCFRFHDGPLNLSRISELRLPHADFAFLSACHTARAFGNLPDEALHLAAGLQLAGFKSVIGTQWSIADIDAPDVAKMVYEYMTQEGRYDHRSAADGLHKAVNELRRRGVATWRWVPFIHLGV